MKRTVVPLSLMLAAALSGCVVAPPMHRAPPPGIYLPPPSVAPGYLWIDGLRLHERGRRTWQPGRWERGPHGNAWEAPHRPHGFGEERGHGRGGWR